MTNLGRRTKIDMNRLQDAILQHKYLATFYKAREGYFDSVSLLRGGKTSAGATEKLRQIYIEADAKTWKLRCVPYAQVAAWIGVLNPETIRGWAKKGRVRGYIYAGGWFVCVDDCIHTAEAIAQINLQPTARQARAMRLKQA